MPSLNGTANALGVDAAGLYRLVDAAVWPTSVLPSHGNTAPNWTNSPYSVGLNGRLRARSSTATAACSGLCALLMSSNHGRDAPVSIRPGHTEATRVPAARSASRRSWATARTAATWATFDGTFNQCGQPFSSAVPSRTSARQGELLVAVSESNPLAVGDAIEVADLSGQAWISSRTSEGETTLGVWPGLPGRPQVVHNTPDWLAKLQLVACGAGITTISPFLLPVLPRGVRALPVRGGSREHRRSVVAHLRGRIGAGVGAVVQALQLVAAQLSTNPSGDQTA